MKVTFFINSMSGGGAERVVCNLSNYLTEHGHNTNIVTFSEQTPPYSLNENVTIEPLIDKNTEESFNFLNRWVYWMKALKKYVTRNKTDCYVVFLPIATIMMLLLRSTVNVPVIASERNDILSYKPMIRILLKVLAHRADGFVFQTESAMNNYGAWVKNVACRVIPNAVNVDFTASIEKNKKDQIVAVGRLTKQKNFPLLIKSFAEIHKRYPKYKLLILGEGSERTVLQEIIDGFGLSEYIKLTGHVVSVKEYLETSAIFVLSSDYEGMPNALIEAMAVGLPCIATDCPCGGPRYLIENNSNGLLVPVGGLDELTDALLRILDDNEFATRLGKEASNIKIRLSPDKIYSEWVKFITGCANT